MHQVAATQIRALLKRRSPHTSLPIFVFDAGYDAVQLAQILGDMPLSLLVRLKSNRCFYANPDSGPTGGHPRWHGAKFDFRDPQTWWDPLYECLRDDTSMGRSTFKPGRRCMPNRIGMRREEPTNHAP